MARRLVAKVGEYTNNQGETKGEYVRVGVIMSGQNGEYILMDPSFNPAGALIKQNVMAGKQGKEQRDMLMISIFDDDNQQQGGQGGYGQGQQGGYQQGQQGNQHGGGFQGNQQQGQPQFQGNGQGQGNASF